MSDKATTPMSQDLMEIYFTAKESFTESDFATLAVILETPFTPDVKKEALMTLFGAAHSRYVEKNGKEPLEDATGEDPAETSFVFL